MSSRYNLRVWTRYLETQQDVWTAKTDPDRLADEFRPWIPYSFPDSARSALRRAFRDEGESVHVELRIGPAGFRWPMSICLDEAGVVFHDTSTNALFRDWRHEHRIHPATDGCLYVDEIQFTPALPRARMWAKLTERMMQHRHQRAATWLRAEQGCIGVAALRAM